MRVKLLSLFSLLVLATAIALAAFARETRPELVEVELATVGFDRNSGTPVALLREPESGEVVPIFIGLIEAQAILQGLHDIASPRPMTHDLLANTIAGLDASLEVLQVHELRNGTYYGRLLLRRSGGNEVTEIDTRPSDGMALAVRTGARIEVSREILRAGLDFDFQAPEGSGDIVQAAGITVVNATGELRQELGLPSDPGVLVSSVRAAAREAGLQAGDLIIAVGERRPSSPLDFLDAIRAVPGEEKARIRYWREGEEYEIVVPTEVPREESAEHERL
ncbi:bifunctional nuclease domain-containing protein [Natronospira bacteriovora]|uniref:DUF151 domain-containing protein n=1 Tax=Natronospira bacteriovora TaxID=3069753 RepID=A0ABU0W9K3_9GAMM|nr:bifunctional nuclease domain-containing protein [Natronospira sp. AB-CW4]MDQ2070721.1 DUF151 domain-containing protein [Natronospira sp. AB-CW4]